MVGGLGAVEYANLKWYYQNNNCFSPSVLSLLNGTISTSGLNANPYAVQWYQYSQQRDGSIYGYGGALSAMLSEKFSVGLSGMILKGSTDDMEVRVGRGRMLFFTSSLRLDRPGTTSFTKTGTSDYSGAEFTLSAEYTSRYFNFGFSVKPPSTITRSFKTTFWQDSVAASKRFLSKIDSIHVATTTSFSGEDKMELPLRGSAGFGLRLRENLTFGITYEIRSYASAQYTGTDGTTTNPWLSCSILHFGGEYVANSWLVLRGGVTNYQEVYQPLTAGIRGEPVNYPVYALGCGINFGNAVLNITYEYSDMKFVDTWSNAVSINRQFTNSIVASLSYELPWIR
jgi:opacity protein-like surface antigen